MGTHSRDEHSDEKGVIRGSYEVREPGCIIRRVDYQADHTHGFKILEISRRPCSGTETKQESTTSQEEESPDTIEEEREGKEADLKEGKDYYPDKREEKKDAAKEKKEKKENVVKKEERKES